jgi:hypothetical protein
MGNASEVVREVGVHDFRVATKQQRFHLDHRLLGVSPGTVGILLWWKVGFEDRFQHQHRCCHADPITQGRDAQRPEFAIGLRYEHSSDGFRSVSLLPERNRQFAKPPLHPVRVDVRKMLSVHTRCALVGAALGVGMCPSRASGWSSLTTLWSGCRVGLAPTGKRRLVTAHTHSGRHTLGKGRSASKIITAVERRPAFGPAVLLGLNAPSLPDVVACRRPKSH